MKFGNQEDTICALSSAQGMGAIALIRISGKKARDIASSITKKKKADFLPNRATFFRIYNEDDVLDEVVITFFENPSSFTGEDIVEVACHGSIYIQQELLKLLILKGARLATPGEFSLRAFLNKKMDLSQTEAIADLIASNSKASHQVAMNQMRGGFSDEIHDLRQELLNFASLIELELDFSQEDVEFADRTALVDLIEKIKTRITKLINSFQLGNVLKEGVPIAIVGPPNAGKSTLLNAILNEEKAIVSDIAGTTRDSIEDVINIDGVNFRFIDTAGLRQTTNVIENLGIKRAFEHIKKARVVLYLVDLYAQDIDSGALINRLKKFKEESLNSEQQLLVVFNKSDLISKELPAELMEFGVTISAKNREGVNELVKKLTESVRTINNNDLIVSNIRHFDVLNMSNKALNKVKDGLGIQIPADLLAMDIREALNSLGEITGDVTNDELLGNIFANFCIGK